MKPINFPESNKTLLKPSNMTDEECGQLPVYCDGNQCISLWKFSLKERLQALIYGTIWVYVISGQTQPPIALSTEKSIFRRTMEG